MPKRLIHFKSLPRNGISSGKLGRGIADPEKPFRDGLRNPAGIKYQELASNKFRALSLFSSSALSNETSESGVDSMEDDSDEASESEKSSKRKSRLHDISEDMNEELNYLGSEDSFDVSLERLIEETKAESAWRKFLEEQEKNSEESDQSLCISFQRAIEILYLLSHYAAKNSETRSRISHLLNLIKSQQNLSHGQTQQLLLTLIQIGQLNEAEELMENMNHDGISVPIHHKAQLIEAYLRFDKQVIKAMQLFKDIRSNNSQILQEERDTADSEVFSAFIRGFSAIGDINSAKSFLNAKTKLGHKISGSDYSSVLACFFKSGKPDDSEAYFKEIIMHTLKLKNLSNFDSDILENSEPSLESFSASKDTFKIISVMIHGFASLADSNKALKYFKMLLSLDAEKEFVNGYEHMLWAYCKAGQIDDAITLFQSMKRSGPAPSPVCLAILMDAFVKKSKFSDAVAIFKGIQNLGIRPNVYCYSILINGYMRQGNVSAAIDALNDMEKREVAPNIVTLTTLMQGYIKNGNFRQASEIYEEIKAKNIPLDAVACTTLLFGAAKAHKFDKVLEIYEDIKGFNLELNEYTYSALIMAYSKLGDLETARMLFDEMESEGLLISSFPYNALLGGYVLNKDVEKAKELVGKLKKDDMQPTVGTYRLLIELSAQEGRIDNVLKFLNLLIRDNSVDKISDYTISHVVKILGEQGDIDMVRLTFKALKHSEESGRVELGPYSWINYIQLLVSNDFIKEAKAEFANIVQKRLRFGESGARSLINIFLQPKIPTANDQYSNDQSFDNNTRDAYHNRADFLASQFEELDEELKSTWPDYWKVLSLPLPGHEETSSDFYDEEKTEDISDQVQAMFSDMDISKIRRNYRAERKPASFVFDS